MQLVQGKYTIAKEIHENPIHVQVIRGPFTRNIGALIPDVADEVAVAVEDAIPKTGDRKISFFFFTSFGPHSRAAVEWVSVVAFPAMTRVVCRASNRVFIGLPLCTCFSCLHDTSSSEHVVLGRNPEYLEIVLQYARDVMKGRFIMTITPIFLKP